MPPSRRLESARNTFAAARESGAQLLAQVASREGELQQTLRDHDANDPAVVTAQGNLAQARQDLLRARSGERAAKDAVQSELDRWLGRFVPADDISEVTDLSSELPLVLLPVKLQTRFLPVGAPTELQVRIYPDVLFADTHETALTAAEEAAGQAYWTRSWPGARLRPSEPKSGLVSTATMRSRRSRANSVPSRMLTVVLPTPPLGDMTAMVTQRLRWGAWIVRSSRCW